jgi:MFS family permease
MWGAFGAFVSENFPPAMRYSGASVSTQLGSVIPGGAAPIVAAFLVAQYGTGYAVAVALAICGVLGLWAAYQLKDYAHEEHMAGEQAE